MAKSVTKPKSNLAPPAPVSEQQKALIDWPRISVSSDDANVVSKIREDIAPHLGASALEFVSSVIEQAIRLTMKNGEIDLDRTHAVIASVVDAKPHNHTQAMLALQMAAVHEATIKAACQLKSAELVVQAECAEKRLNKLARTFVSQAEAMKKLQQEAQQTVRVERVYVNEGGQAIVGNVQGGGGDSKNGGTSP